MSDRLTPEVVDTLVCELGRRPLGAPTIDRILPAVTSLGRDADGLTVAFDPAATDVVWAVVDAERQCCSSIGWELEAAPGSRLRIKATPAQLDALGEMFGQRA